MIGHDPQRTYKAAVIGAGSAGLTLAIGLAGFGHDVVLIEGDKVGGDCTNVGCIPSKALLHAAEAGLDEPLSWVRAKRDDLASREDHEMEDHPHIYLVRGWASLTSHRDPHVVSVAGVNGPTEVRAENVIICGGSRPIVFPIDGLAEGRLITNESVFELDGVPASIVLVGGGVISLEMATAFADLGTRVDIVELQDRLLGNEDPLVSIEIRAALEARGVRVHTGTSIDRFDESSTSAHLTDGTVIVDVDKVLIGVGRQPRLDTLGLEVAGVEHSARGIVADDWGKTSVDGIFAVGDITGNTLTTHGANAIGRRAIRAIALSKIPQIGGPRALPNAVYSRPQIASVGLTVAEIDALSPRGRQRYTKRFPDVDRGYTDGVEHGFVTVDVERFTGKILRAVIVGSAAAEMIGMFTIMIDNKIGLRKMFGTVHPYPTYSQAIGLIADDFATATFRRLPQEWWAMMRARVRNRLKR